MKASPGIVHLLDDDALLRRALTRLLRAQGWEVRAAATLEDFLAAWRPDEIACLVLDVSMPALNGLEVQQRLQAGEIHIPILFLTGHGDIPMSVRALKAGATDFLTKPVDERALLVAVEHALKIAADRQSAVTRFSTLTPRERQVMKAVVMGRLNKQIAAELGTGEQNIKLHRARVMEKMGADSVADLVRTAERLGL